MQMIFSNLNVWHSQFTLDRMVTYIELALQVKLYLAGVEKSLEKLSGLGSISLGQSFESAIAHLTLCEGIVLGSALPTSELLLPAFISPKVDNNLAYPIYNTG